MMKQITRNEAETLINLADIVRTDVRQNSEDLTVFLTLSDSRSFLIRYNLLKHEKSYFLKKPTIQ